MTPFDESCDAYYEAQGQAAADEAQHELEYQSYLESLLNSGQTALFAAHVALDWLNSKEFADSGMDAKHFIEYKKGKFEKQEY